MESTSTPAAVSNNPISIILLAKWGKERIEITALDPQATIGQVKSMITERTNVLPKRQKLIGLTTKSKAKVTDDTVLMDLKIKPGKSDKNEENVIYHSFILMGTAESNIFVDPSDREDLPDVVDDFDLDFNAGSDQVSPSHCYYFHFCLVSLSTKLKLLSTYPSYCSGWNMQQRK